MKNKIVPSKKEILRKWWMTKNKELFFSREENVDFLKRSSIMLMMTVCFRNNPTESPRESIFRKTNAYKANWKLNSFKWTSPLRLEL